MKRIPVKSSSLASLGYDAATGILEVEFRNHRCYQYFVVPQHVFKGLIAAESKGTYLNEHIRGRFPFTQLS